MTAAEFMEQLFRADDPAGAFDRETCDTLKAGDPEREISRVAVTMFGTPAVLRAAAEWGAELLIVHEPMFFDHMDRERGTPVAQLKLQLLRETGLTVYRYHDYIHFRQKDGIHEGFLKESGLQGTMLKPRIFVLDNPMTGRELLEFLRQKLDLATPRLAGTPDVPFRTLALYLGSGAGLLEAISDPAVDVLICGEVSEWKVSEYVKEAAEFGIAKAVLALGHTGSERDGMKLFAEEQQKLHPELAFRYFESGEVYLK